MGRAFEVRKRSMAKTDAARVRVFSKYGKEIYIAAKGNPDPDTNVELKRIIEKARKDEVTNEVINRAIKRAKGGFDDNYVDVRYEGFGPGGSMFVIECLTDNVNRTISEVRNCFTKTDSKLGISGSVVHMFKRQSVFAVKNLTEEEALDIIIENDIDANDIEADEQGVSIFGNDTDYSVIRTALMEATEEDDLVTDEIMWLPMIEVTINNETDQKNFDKLIDMLDDVEDVKDVYHNVTL